MIKIYFHDHAPPHFHVEHGEHEAVVTIQTLEVVRGKLSSRARAMVLEWASMHRHELMQDWNRAQAGKPLRKIAPLM